MFSSDKELRKVPPKRGGACGRDPRPAATSTGSAMPKAVSGFSVTGSAVGGVGGNNDRTGHGGAAEADQGNGTSTVERVRHEREMRQKNREMSQKAIIIQKFWRGRWRAWLVINGERTALEKKLSDIDKLAKVLALKNVAFAPPPNIVVELIRHLFSLRFGGHYQDHLLLNKLCNIAIIPSLQQLERSKNIAFFIVQPANIHLLSMLYNRAIIKELLYVQSSSAGVEIRSSESAVPVYRSKAQGANKAILASTLHHLLGFAGPLKMKFTADLAADFVAIRQVTIGTDIQQAMATLRDILLVISSPLTQVMSEDTTYYSSSSSGGSAAVFSRLLASTTAVEENPTDIIVGIAMRLAAPVPSFVSMFARLIMTVPVLTRNLSIRAIRELVTWSEFSAMMSALNSMLMARSNSNTYDCDWPRSPHAVISSGHWTFGNIASFAPYFIVVSARTAGQEMVEKEQRSSSSHSVHVDDASLQQYLQLTVQLMDQYNVPGVLQGKGSVLWTRTGTTLAASGIPKALQDQVLMLLTPQFNKDLFHRILLPLRQELVELASPRDLQDINASMKSTALAIAKSTLTEQQESSKMFTSKWALKLLGKVSKSIGLPSGITSGRGGAANSSGSAVPPDGDSEPLLSLAAAASGAPLPETAFAPNAVLIRSLCHLWSFTLTLASHAKIDSLPWKALSSLVFSTRIIDRMWVAALYIAGDMSALETMAERFDGRNDYFGAKGPASDKSADVWHAMAALVSVLKITLITVDDSEIYDEGRPLPLHQLLPFVRYAKLILYKAIEADPAVINEPNKKGTTITAKLVSSPLPTPTPPSPQPAVSSNTNSSASNSISSMFGSLFGFSSSKPAAPAASATAVALPTNASNNLSNHSNQTTMIEQSLSAEFHGLLRYCAIQSISVVLSDLHTRWARRPFSGSHLWEVSAAESSSVQRQLREQTPFALALLRVMSWSVSFNDRMKLFRDFVDDEKRSIQGSNDAMSAVARSRGTVVQVRRSMILEDGMTAFSKVGSAIKDRIVVRYINNMGQEEAGIDVGGLFKDFLTDLSGRVFDPSYGLFSSTTLQHLYPNPAALMLYGESNMEDLFAFLGRVLGKALFENITIQPQFAHFFLAFMHGKYNFIHLIDDLRTLDAELYKNLMFLKSYEGDIADLSLSFAITDDTLGEHKEIELMPGGSSLAVTSQNRHRYISLVAKYYLHDRIHVQARSFFHGLYQVIQPDLLSIFCAPELQILISGSSSGLSLDDWKQNTQYAGGYTSIDRNVSRFWAVVAELDDRDRAMLLRFVTSCERPPSLGFTALQPPFTIQRVDNPDNSRLPTASTCFNILKLPTYSSQAILKEKLLTSIRSGAGFDLS